MTIYRDRLPAWAASDGRIKLDIRVGELHPSSSLSDEQKTYIRRHFATGVFTQRELARAYNVSPPTIHKAVRKPRPSGAWTW